MALGAAGAATIHEQRAQSLPVHLLGKHGSNDLAGTFPFAQPAADLGIHEVETYWAAAGILEAVKPGRMQGHGGTEEVPR